MLNTNWLYNILIILSDQTLRVSFTRFLTRFHFSSGTYFPIQHPKHYIPLHFSIEKAVIDVLIFEVESENCFSFWRKRVQQTIVPQIIAAHSLFLIILKHGIQKLSGKRINPYRTLTTNKYWARLNAIPH